MKWRFIVLLSLTSSELAVLDFIQEHLRCGFLDWFLPKFTLLANSGILWIGIAVFLLLWPAERRTGAEMAIALIACLLLGNCLLKPLVARVRPFDANTLIQLIAEAPTDFSFPSGHTYSSFAAATVLLLHHRRWGIAAAAVACLIAFSRLYLYFHYPTDVLAGMLMGILLGLASHCCVGLFLKRRSQRSQR